MLYNISVKSCDYLYLLCYISLFFQSSELRVHKFEYLFIFLFTTYTRKSSTPLDRMDHRRLKKGIYRAYRTIVASPLLAKLNEARRIRQCGEASRLTLYNLGSPHATSICCRFLRPSQRIQSNANVFLAKLNECALRTAVNLPKYFVE